MHPTLDRDYSAYAPGIPACNKKAHATKLQGIFIGPIMDCWSANVL